MYHGDEVYRVDIGGTSVKIGLFEVTGELLDKWEVKTRKEDGGIPDPSGRGCLHPRKDEGTRAGP